MTSLFKLLYLWISNLVWKSRLLQPCRKFWRNLFPEDNAKMKFHKITLYCKQCSDWTKHICVFGQHTFMQLLLCGPHYWYWSHNGKYQVASCLKELTTKRKATQATAILWDFLREVLRRGVQFRFISQPPTFVSQS